jgi:polar amino acid transport system substrate-binding protein
MRRLLVHAIIMITMCGAALAQPAAEIAPSGKLRVGLAVFNPVLVSKKPDGTLGGVSVELARFIAEKLGVPFEPVMLQNTEHYTGSFGKGEWDIAIGPRGAAIAEKADFSPEFMLVDNIYAAAPGRDFADASQVDRSGVKIGVSKDGAPDQLLTRTIKAAELVRITGSVPDAAIEALRTGRADVYGSNGENVFAVTQGLPGSKIVPGAFATVRMAVALPKGRSAAAQAKLAEIVNQAKAAGIAQKAIEQQALKGVRTAE